jgi:endonuclease/exonuclease/phosphatase family metal-dependent hydrolase
MKLSTAIQLVIVVSGFGGIVTPARAAEQAGPLRVVSHNVWNGFQEKPEPRRQQWLAWMADQHPDVVALQELNGYTPGKLAGDAKTWGHPHFVLLKEDGFPTALTSRTPITEVKRIREGMHHGLLRGKIRGIYFYVIHFHPSHYERRIEEARFLIADIGLLSERDPRIVLIGDFNGFSPDDQVHYERDPELEPFFVMLDQQYPASKNLNAGKLDYGGIIEILSAGFVDLVARLRPPDSPFMGTFPTELRRPENLGTDRRLDYVFASPALAGSVKSAAIVRDKTTAMLSDHYPLVVDLDLP